MAHPYTSNPHESDPHKSDPHKFDYRKFYPFTVTVQSVLSAYQGPFAVDASHGLDWQVKEFGVTHASYLEVSDADMRFVISLRDRLAERYPRDLPNCSLGRKNGSSKAMYHRVPHGGQQPSNRCGSAVCRGTASVRGKCASPPCVFVYPPATCQLMY